MVSKRKYFSIVIMMLVLLFLFQFSVVMRDQQNAYDTNSYFHQRQQMEKMNGRLQHKRVQKLLRSGKKSFL